MSSEFARIDQLRALFADSKSEVLVGIGDDAAVLAPSSCPLVWTVDAAVEGVHFRRDLMSLAEIGFRATMAAVSDIAAMGARPIGVLSSLVLPRELSDQDLLAIAQGQKEATEMVETAVLGGNLARGSEISITTTVLGRAVRALTRSGARPGDQVWVAGPIGLAGAGLRILLRGPEDGLLSASARQAVEAFRRPFARIADGLAVNECATAAIDTSDGLAGDLGHVATQSQVQIVLDAEVLVSPILQEVARELDEDPIQLALHGGEDYALAVTVPPGTPLPSSFRQVGEVRSSSQECSVLIRQPNGTTVPVDPSGFDHFG